MVGENDLMKKGLRLAVILNNFLALCLFVGENDLMKKGLRPTLLFLTI